MSRGARQPLPELPQLWMQQPRMMTPQTPFTGSTGRSASVTPSSMPGSRGLGALPMRPPLRRMDSDPGLHRGYIDPALKLRRSPETSKDAQVGDRPCLGAASRYTTTFTFG